jgi:hypothetical protein
VLPQKIPASLTGVSLFIRATKPLRKLRRCPDRSRQIDSLRALDWSSRRKLGATTWNDIKPTSPPLRSSVTTNVPSARHDFGGCGYNDDVHRCRIFRDARGNSCGNCVIEVAQRWPFSGLAGARPHRTDEWNRLNLQRSRRIIPIRYPARCMLNLWQLTFRTRATSCVKTTRGGSVRFNLNITLVL